MPCLSACVPATFSPTLFGAEILSIQASPVTNVTRDIYDAFRLVAPTVQLINASFCNVTVAYTHPGQGDKITVETWLPPRKEWNEKILAVGGGGYIAGRGEGAYGAMYGALADGFATFSTDAGLGDTQDSRPWALNSPGNVNLYNLQNLGSVSLLDEVDIGKSVIQSYYGRPAKYSYWAGCSQGGRQGLTLAQRYPDAFDGIIAAAPALHISRFFPYMHWPQQFMNEMGVWPHGCEIDAITAAAVKECDGLDGVVDGVIALVDECLQKFDPFSIVGKEVTCSQASGSATPSRVVSEAAAKVVNASWHGQVTKEGRLFWPGVMPGTDLTGNLPTSYGAEGVAKTNCTVNGRGEEECTGTKIFLSEQWLELFLARGDPTFDISNLTRAEFDRLSNDGYQRYSSLIDTADPDLTRFRDAGGKLIAYHGLADNLIPPHGTEQYFKDVSSLVPNVESFFQYYEIPGMAHCFGGVSKIPTSVLAQIQDWVENGTAPAHVPITLVSETVESRQRILCPYPQRPVLSQSCATPGTADCWSCAGGQ